METTKLINGKIIEEARMKRGLSCEEAAALLGCTRQHYYRLEDGEHIPRGKLMRAIQAELGIHPSQLFQPVPVSA